MIKLPVRGSRLDKILPYTHQILQWNAFFNEETAELLRFEVTGKSFAKKIKEHILQTYYEECELRHCYSCSERMRIKGEKQAQLAKIQAEKQAKELEKQRKEEEETYWYIIEDRKKKEEAEKLTS